MKLKGKVVLITGGASGIGLEAAKQFLANGASVLITGRNTAKLEAAKKMYPALITINSDVSRDEDARQLVAQVQQLGGIDILYNNAGVLTEPLNLAVASEKHVADAAYEMNVNYLGVIRLANLFMPMLTTRPESAIINTTSILSYVPSILEATYSASKVALRFYTESLRKHLQIVNSPVKVFELIPPVVATDMTADRTDKKITSEALVHALIKGLRKNQLTIRVGDTKSLYILSRLSPKLAYSLVNPTKSYQFLHP
ncbi:SDR family oxidoreductase [Larkinella knui]|uniref:SDR family NAD(P)-dependent oxidoreductase n=1 Tax=Larkinella knui TaxID=2025310 RepID=A0A3P1CLK6_9BACT|nr:SDR family NAD(P)-dependent oxidoreductase [Larkinella knui]RRB14212.1 SDR family NAD(P)-dependent oxidoreductase [Larkinella knui]